MFQLRVFSAVSMNSAPSRQRQGKHVAALPRDVRVRTRDETGHKVRRSPYRPLRLREMMRCVAPEKVWHSTPSAPWTVPGSEREAPQVLTQQSRGALTGHEDGSGSLQDHSFVASPSLSWPLELGKVQQQSPAMRCEAASEPGRIPIRPLGSRSITLQDIAMVPAG